MITHRGLLFIFVCLLPVQFPPNLIAQLWIFLLPRFLTIVSEFFLAAVLYFHVFSTFFTNFKNLRIHFPCRWYLMAMISVVLTIFCIHCFPYLFRYLSFWTQPHRYHQLSLCYGNIPSVDVFTSFEGYVQLLSLCRYFLFHPFWGDFHLSSFHFRIQFFSFSFYLVLPF